MTKKTILLLILISLILVISLSTKKILTANYSEFTTIKINTTKATKSINKICDNLDTVTFENFPYEKYLQNINYMDVNAIDKNISELDTLTKNSFLAQNILSNALTNKSLNQFNTNNIDSLNMLLNIADEYKIYAKFKKQKKLFFVSVYDFWYSYTAKKLNKLLKQNLISKFDFKYKYLVQKCSDNGYLKNEGYTLKEKTFINIIDNNWSYLLNRFWFATSIFFKIIVFILFSIFLTVSFLTIKCSINKIKKL